MLKGKGRPRRTLLPPTDEALQRHLTVKEVVGVYPLLPDETCYFLAADFDKDGWQQDAGAFVETCENWGISTALERSRSGRGGHVWLFFQHAIPAVTARKLGTALLTQTMERRHQIGMDSYDRLFPNQDIMPKGGFGKLIALPLQGGPRKEGNSVFVDGNFEPYPDQWACLSTRLLLSLEKIEAVVSAFERTGNVLGLREINQNDDRASGDTQPLDTASRMGCGEEVLQRTTLPDSFGRSTDFPDIQPTVNRHSGADATVLINALEISDGHGQKLVF